MLNFSHIHNKHSLVLIVILAILLGALPVFSLGSAIMFVVIGLAGLGLYIYLPKEDKKFLMRMYIVSFAARFFILIITYYISASFTNWRGEISPDSRYFTIYALELSREWRGSDIIAATAEMHGENWYTYMLAYFYTLVNYGRGSLSPAPMLADKLINVFIAMLSIIVIFYIAKDIFGSKIAKLAALLVAFWPSFIIWSITNLRDPLNILLSSVMLWAIIKFYKRNKLRYILIALFSIACFKGARTYLFVPHLIIAIFFFFIYLRIKPFTKVLLFIVLFAMLTLNTKPVNFGEKIDEYKKRGFPYISIILNMNRNIIAQGGSSYQIYDGDVNVNNKVNEIKFFRGFLKGLFYFMLIPFPWAITSNTQILFYPQIILWYFLLPFSFLGILWALRYRLWVSMPIVVYLFVITCAYALVEGNVGSALRHRDLVSVFYLIFSAAGLMRIFGLNRSIG